MAGCGRLDVAQCDHRIAGAVQKRAAVFAVFNSLSLLEPFDGQINPLVQLGNFNLYVFLGISADGRTLYTGSFAP